MLIKTAKPQDLIPQLEGITHYNIYSKSRTELGRFLSHFQEHPMQTEDGYFACMEGYWYWLSRRDERLRQAVGYEAKRLGESLRCCELLTEHEFSHKIKAATIIKLETMPKHLLKELYTSRLPLIHAYVHQGKYTIQTSMNSIIALINHRRVFLRVDIDHDN